jgi:hypothetical protein
MSFPEQVRRPSRFFLFLLVFLFGWVLLLPFPSISGQDMRSPVSFTWNGQKYRILYLDHSSGCDLLLHGNGTFNLSSQYPGENLFPQVQILGQRVLIAWINDFNSVLSVIVYSLDRGQWLQVALPGFRFVAHPQYQLQDQEIEALFFLGNRSGQNDIFYYHPQSHRLKNLTQTPHSKQGFQLSF